MLLNALEAGWPDVRALKELNMLSESISKDVFNAGCSHGALHIWEKAQPSETAPTLAAASLLEGPLPSYIYLSGSSFFRNSSIFIGGAVVLDADVVFYNAKYLGLTINSNSSWNVPTTLEIRVETHYGCTESLFYHVVALPEAKDDALRPSQLKLSSTYGFAPAYLYISGEHLCDAHKDRKTNVTFTHASATKHTIAVVCYNPQSLGVNLPFFPPGNVSVVVETAHGSSDSVTYIVQDLLQVTPEITGISSYNDAQWVYLNGKGFHNHLSARLLADGKNFSFDSIQVYSTELAGFSPPYHFPETFTVSVAQGDLVSNEFPFRGCVEDHK